MTEASAILLAGGASSRMGCDKAALAWGGTTLLAHQIMKLRDLGIEDIILSGYAKAFDGTRSIADVYPGCGPLGGIHAGLLAARRPHCLVLSVDVPLVPAQALRELLEAHEKEGNAITVLSHKGLLEPLMGVYERSLAGAAEELLRSGRRSVRSLLQRVGVSTLDYSGDGALLTNCNTPEEYRTLLSL